MNKNMMKTMGSVTFFALLVVSSFTGLVSGDDVYEIHIETDRDFYYQGEQVLITIQLWKNGEGYPGGICPNITDPEKQTIYGNFCAPTDPNGYYNITDFYLDSSAMLGTYNINIHAYIDGWEGSNNATFKVVSQTLTAEAHGPYQGVVGQPVQFSGDVVGGKPPYTWYWQFGDNGFSYERNATHIYEEEEMFTAVLNVTDAGGFYDEDPAIVLIQNPVYSLSVETDRAFYFTVETVQIFGQLMQDDFGIEGVINITVFDPSQIIVFTNKVDTNENGFYNDSFTLLPQSPVGVYTVLVTEEQLEVMNATTFDVFSSTITVDAHGPYEGKVGQPIQFFGDATGGMSPYTWYWVFDDNENSSEQNPTHSYQAPGQYQVMLTVNDSYQHVGNDVVIVSVTESTIGNHTVLIEEGTATWCNNCPAVAQILHELYESGDFNFYYVAMVEDKCTLAHHHLYDDYNIYGFPTTYLDGGFNVVVGGPAQTVFEEAIQEATSREVPDLEINLMTLWNETSNEVETMVSIHNLEGVPYHGVLRVYLTEINSRWTDYDGKPYHYGFLDYLVNEEISIPAGEIITRSNKTDATGLYPANLMIIASVFNATSHQAYSNPPSGNPFDAYYVDATVGARVAEGNLPPEVGITSPKSGRIHLFGKVIWTTPQLKTILLGRTMITAQASDDSNVTRVEFYIDDTLVATFTAEPYEWLWKTPTWFNPRRTIKVIAYDDEEQSSTVTMDVSAFILL